MSESSLYPSPDELIPSFALSPLEWLWNRGLIHRNRGVCYLHWCRVRQGWLRITGLHKAPQLP